MMQRSTNKTLIAVVFIAVSLILVLTINRQQQEARKAFEESAEAYESRSDSRLPLSDRLQKVQRSYHGDPASALTTLEQVLAQPADPAETQAAGELMPQVLAASYRDRKKAGDLDRARSFWSRLRHEFPGDSNTNGVQRDWGNNLDQQIKEAIKTDRPALLEAAFLEYVDGGFYLPRRDERHRWRDGNGRVLQAFAEHRLRQWKALPPAQRSGPSGMSLAADGFGMVLDHNATFGLARIFEEAPAIPGQELQSLHDFFATRGFAAHALNAVTWANLRLRSNDGWTADPASAPDYTEREKIRINQERAIMQLGLKIADTFSDDPLAILTPLPVIHLLDALAKRVNTSELRTPLLRKRLELQMADYLERTAGLAQRDLLPVAGQSISNDDRRELGTQLHHATAIGREILGQRRTTIFRNILQESDQRPSPLWREVDPTVINQIKAGLRPGLNPSQLESEKRSALLRLVNDGAVPNPVSISPEMHRRVLTVTALNGIYNLRNDRESAFRDLRIVVQSGDYPELIDRVKAAVQTAFHRSSDNEKFVEVVELGGFYDAEFDLNFAGDPFTTQFRKSLVTSAEMLQDKQPMKYIFVQSLLADVFPDEPIGQRARAETLRSAFERVSTIPVETQFSSTEASALDHASSVSVDNSTEYHILMVYDGPEQFTVLCSPKRKGSFTLANGTYRIAVLTPLGDVVPYHAKRTFSNQHAPSNYHIESSGDDASAAGLLMGGSNATGNYTLLRQSESTPGTIIDPHTGKIMR